MHTFKSTPEADNSGACRPHGLWNTASTLPPSADRVLISVNPTAGRGAGRPIVERLTELLRQHGQQVEVLSDLARTEELAGQWHTAGRLRALVAAGGDGTIAEMLNRTPPGVPIGLLPLGTENLLAKYVGLTPTAEAACAAIMAGRTARLDAGRAAGRLFTLMVSCGFDADVIERLHLNRSGPIRHWSYAKPILQAIRSYEYPELKVYFDQEPVGAAWPQSVSARWMFLFNLPCYARGLPLAPEAGGNDGWFDLCTFQRGTLWHALRYLTATVRRRHPTLRDCFTARVRRVRVESSVRVPYQLDGDPGGVLPVDIEILPERFTLVLPVRQFPDGST
jgi:diacylglycerol kinase family enzyme